MKFNFKDSKRWDRLIINLFLLATLFTMIDVPITLYAVTKHGILWEGTAFVRGLLIDGLWWKWTLMKIFGLGLMFLIISRIEKVLHKDEIFPRVVATFLVGSPVFKGILVTITNLREI